MSRAPRVASYQLKARLDTNLHEVHARGTIRWTNPSASPTNALYFHLYLNAFESDETLFLRGKASRSGRRPGRHGGITVVSLTSNTFQGVELWPGPDAHTPGDPKDRTDIRVELPEPVAGYATIELQTEFIARLPQIVERTGYERDFYFLGQWFPKLAKREKDGTWAHFPFHPNGEFYADFGDYDVEMDVPENYVVGSTGTIEQSQKSADGRVVHRAKARAVHDFAWTAWPHFIVEKRRIRGASVRFLRPPHVPLSAQRTWATLEQGLPFLEDALTPYPYDSLTVVHPPTFARRAGGMEYPQLITTGSSEIAEIFGAGQVERVTIHELGHQWFQGLLASNEMEVPFLDEGLTSYAEARYVDAVLGPRSALSVPGLSVSRLAGARLFHFSAPSRRPITSRAADFRSFSSIGSLVYARSSLGFETLARIYSPEKLHAALKLYAREQLFRHPDLTTFYDTLERTLGSDGAELARQIFDEAAGINLSVGAIESVKESSSWTSQVTIQKEGKLDVPSEVLLRFEDGTTTLRALSAKEMNTPFVVVHQSPLVSVFVDPERKIMLDDNLVDNRKHVDGVPTTERLGQRSTLWVIAGWLSQLLSP